MTRRFRAAAVLFVVAALGVLPQFAFGQAETVDYLASDGVPEAGFQLSAPTGALPNHDPARNSDPGLTLELTTPSSKESDPNRHQLWAQEAAAQTIAGELSLWIHAAVVDFDVNAAGELTAYLLDCNAPLKNCKTLASASYSASPWSSAGDWVQVRLGFGYVEAELAANRRLSVKLLVTDGVGESDMWIAYDAAGFESRLTYTEGQPTTTTTTAPTTTTTTAPTTTTTTSAATTTTTTTPATTTSTTIVSTTSTTIPSTTTTAPSTPESNVTTTIVPSPSEPSTTTTAGSSTQESQREEDTATEVVVSTTLPPDLALPTLDDNPMPTEPPSDGLLHAVELVLPESVATFVLSPFVVLSAIGRAFASTGAAVSAPAAAAGFILGFLIVFFDRGRGTISA